MDDSALSPLSNLSFSEWERSHPPRPPLVLNVGVVGHRPNLMKRPDPNVAALRRTIGDVLRLISNGFGGVAATRGELFESFHAGRRTFRGLRILSSLAQGADLWVVDEALILGYTLQAALPFARAEYAKDFVDPAALEEYQRLLSRADAVLELDGTRDGGRASESYQAASRTLIQQSDLLIALWDGDEEIGRGGTGQSVREALLHGVPVVWIPWAGPSGEWRFVAEPYWHLIEQPEDLKGDAERLTEVLAELLLPPDLRGSPSHREPPSLRSTYYSERQPGFSPLSGLWSAFSNALLLGARGTHGKPMPTRFTWQVRIPPFDETTRASWVQEQSDCPALADLMRKADEHYFAHYAWSNQASVHYANLYRSGFVLNFALGALAVFFALLGIGPLLRGEPETPSIVFELLVITLIVVVTLVGSQRRWHERWIEYRTLAERLRLSRFMSLLGGWRQDATLPGHLTSYGDPTNSWVYWHYKAVERAFGFHSAEFDEHRLEAIRSVLHRALAQGQALYHHANERYEIMDGRLHRLGTAFFLATFVACTTHLVLGLFWKPPEWASAVLLTLNALLPACGAAITAIRSQGEFRRVAQRSRSMAQELDLLRFRLSVVPTRGTELRSQEIRHVSDRIARLMLKETLDWRVVFQDRPIVLPT